MTGWFYRKRLMTSSHKKCNLTFGDVLLGNITFLFLLYFWCITHYVAVNIAVFLHLLYLLGTQNAMRCAWLLIPDTNRELTKRQTVVGKLKEHVREYWWLQPIFRDALLWRSSAVEQQQQQQWWRCDWDVQPCVIISNSRLWISRVAGFNNVTERIHWSSLAFYQQQLLLLALKSRLTPYHGVL